MDEAFSGFLVGVCLMLAAVGFVSLLVHPWQDGYCAAACGEAGVVEVSEKVCTCGPEDAPVAVKIREGE